MYSSGLAVSLGVIVTVPASVQLLWPSALYSSFALSAHHDELKSLPWDAGKRWARLYFTDRRLFEDHEDWTWARPVPRAELDSRERQRIGRDGIAVDACLFEGSPYLARLIVSCGGACTSDNPEVKAQVRRLLATLP